MAYLPFRNIGLKFLSLCIALLLWLVVAGDRVAERSVRVPLEFQNLPEGIEIVGNTPDTIEVRVRGQSGVLSRVTTGDTAAVIDLRTARPGQRLFHLTPAQITVPYGVEVVQVSPSTLPVAFETSGVRIVTVQPSVEGRPAPGYEVTGVAVDPPTVEVVGPEGALRGLTEAITEPISVANASRPLRETVTIGVADPSVRLRRPQTAAVNVRVSAASAEQTVRGVPVRLRNLGAGLRGEVMPSQVAVTVRGSEAAVANATPETIELYVDAASLGAGEYTLPVRMMAAPEVAVSSFTPATVRIRIIRTSGT